MNIVPYKAEHLRDFQLQEGQRDLWPFISPEYARYLENQFSFTALHEGRVLAVGGVAELWPDRGLAWALISEGAGPYFTELHRAAKRMLDAVPFRRVEADTPCEFKQGKRWLKMLGFKLEAERMIAYRPDGGDSSLYARVK